MVKYKKHLKIKPMLVCPPKDVTMHSYKAVAKSHQKFDFLTRLNINESDK